MGLFDRILNTKPTLRICMFGPRGVGKTTVMASVFKDSQESVADSALYMRSADVFSDKLIQYTTDLEEAFVSGNASNLPATNAEADYMFDMGVKAKPATVAIQIKDFPGEYLTDTQKPENIKKVEDFVKESNIIMVAIDSPFMMEEGGKLNLEKNKPDVVKQFFRNHPDSFRDKLVLFVPLKSEIYLHTGRMDQLSQRVKEMYGDLVPYFKQNNIASVIVPIMTLGGIELDKMQEEFVKGEVVTVAKFRFWEPNPVYAPLFCAQPLFYLLTYISNYYEWLRKQDMNVLKRLKNMLFAYLTKDDVFRTEISKMHKHIIRDSLGFETLTSNSIFKL